MSQTIRLLPQLLTAIAFLLAIGCQSETPPAKPAAKQEPAAEKATDPINETVARLIADLRADPEEVDAPAALAALGEISVPALRKELSHSNPDVRTTVIETLEKINEKSAREALLIVLKDSDEDVRLIGVEAMGRVAHPVFVPPLVEQYKTDPDDQVRYEILTTLGMIGDPSVTQMLVKESSSEDHYVRMWAADALCQYAAPESQDVAIRLLSDPNTYVRQRIILSCPNALGRADAQAGLIHMAIHGESFEEAVGARRVLQQSLATPGSEQLRDRIKTVAMPELKGERALFAAFVLADLNDPSGIDVIRQNYKHNNTHVRHHVAFELGRISGAASIPVLAEMLNDPTELVAATAYDALLNFVDQGKQEAAAAVADYKGAKFPTRLKDMAKQKGLNY